MISPKGSEIICDFYKGEYVTNRQYIIDGK